MIARPSSVYRYDPSARVTVISGTPSPCCVNGCQRAFLSALIGGLEVAPIERFREGGFQRAGIELREERQAAKHCYASELGYGPLGVRHRLADEHNAEHGDLVLAQG